MKLFIVYCNIDNSVMIYKLKRTSILHCECCHTSTALDLVYFKVARRIQFTMITSIHYTQKLNSCRRDMRTQLFRLRYTSHGSSAHIRNDKNTTVSRKTMNIYEAQRSVSDSMKSANKLTYRTPAETECFLLHLVHLHLSRYGCHITSFVIYQPVSRKRANTDVKQERRWITSAWVFLWNSSSFIIEISYRNFGRYHCWFISIGPLLMCRCGWRTSSTLWQKLSLMQTSSIEKGFKHLNYSKVQGSFISDEPTEGVKDESSTLVLKKKWRP